MHKKRQWFVMEVSKQFKWALVTPHLYILFCQKVSSSEDTGLYCNSSHIKSDGRNGTCLGPTVVEVDTSTYLRLFWLLISTRINFFRVDQLEILKHEQNVDGLNGCFLLAIRCFLFLSTLLTNPTSLLWVVPCTHCQGCVVLDPP